MNRLFLWIISAFITVSLISLVTIPMSQRYFLQQSFNSLDPDFRKLLEEKTRPPAFLLRPPKHDRPPATIPDIIRHKPNFTLRDYLLEQNKRLYKFFADYRLAQQKGVFFGVLIALALSTILASIIARLISKPIEAVSQAARKIAAGDLSARVPMIKARAPRESRDLTANFNIMAEGLERYEGERTAMFADIAHELRNPLATMRLRLDALDDGLVNFNKNELELLSNQVNLLSRLTTDLRTLSLADHGKLSLTKQVVKLEDLIENIVMANQARAKQNNIELSFVQNTNNATINADPDRLSQVINNLVDNSFKAVDKHGWIKIILDKNKDHITITVQDSGPGFKPEQLENLFSRFKKGQRRDLNEKSSGLGLAIAKALVDLHKGTISAQNHPNGTEITITLNSDSPS